MQISRSESYLFFNVSELELKVKDHVHFKKRRKGGFGIRCRDTSRWAQERPAEELGSMQETRQD